MRSMIQHSLQLGPRGVPSGRMIVAAMHSVPEPGMRYKLQQQVNPCKKLSFFHPLHKLQSGLRPHHIQLVIG